MARFDRMASPHGPVVQGFVAGGFSVDGGVYAGLLLTPQRADAWDAPDLDSLSVEALEPILAIQPPPEFVLLGSGATCRFPPRAFVAALEQRGIGVETMDSRAAARTWGLLRAEERWIVAAIMPVG
jgi:uncharacterized protein